MLIFMISADILLVHLETQKVAVILLCLRS